MSHREFCERFVAAIQVGDRDAMAAMLHPDFVVVEPEGLPYRGVYRGVDGWFALTKAVIGAWGTFKLETLEHLGETADSFVVRFGLSGRSRKTGRSFETTVLELWRFKDGKLIEILPYYFDTHLLAMADLDQ